ncbi:hypothetical protein [Bacillus suaedae]|uniref:Uncharacterized protein n=1 Tax=Halalkalibacter suaedae TaxID=2822140 RepID=A0A941AMW4_9BACI|nr:hypothetical protein [Bacillus suaedae]MBP3949662.1 hypothetical protein [Bacillus suaedae]
MKYLNERGYSLLLTLVITLIFGLLATLLLSMTMGGFLRTEIREDVVQVEEVTEKGLDHLSQEIQTKLEEMIGTSGIPREQFITKLNETLNNYTCTSSKLENSGETGDYSACLSAIEPVTNADGTENELRKKITLLSRGIVDGRERELKTTMEVGSQSVPDALNYALGAHILCKSNDSSCSQIPGEGNMFLHGGVDIYGDVKVDGDLITTDRGYAFFSGSEQWIDSLYPSIRGTKPSQIGNVVLGGNVYSFNSTPTYANHIRRNSFSSTYTKKTNSLQDAFTIAPQIVARQPTRKTHNILEQKKNNEYAYNDPGVTYLSGSHNVTTSGLHYPNRRVFIGYGYGWYGTEIRGLTLTGTNTFGNLFVNGDLKLTSSNSRETSKATFLNGLFVDGDLTIGNNSSSYDPSNYAKIQLFGNIYVTGDLIIKGADAEVDAIINVGGKVIDESTKVERWSNTLVEHSRLAGLPKGEKEIGSLIVFSKGTITIRNNSVYQDDPSEIKGYFYSDDAFEMFGVGSNIKIIGGISARRIVLNGVRGMSDTSSFPNSVRYGNRNDWYYYHNRTAQTKQNSRLQVIYNEKIDKIYSDLQANEPIITSIDKPKLLNREVVE